MKYTCSICGKSFDDLDAYLKDVTACTQSTKKKVEEEKKAKELQEANTLVNKTKQAKKYFEDCLIELADKYPKAFMSLLEESEFTNGVSVNYYTGKKAKTDTDTNTITNVAKEDDFLDAVKCLLSFLDNK